MFVVVAYISRGRLRVHRHLCAHCCVRVHHCGCMHMRVCVAACICIVACAGPREENFDERCTYVRPAPKACFLLLSAETQKSVWPRPIAATKTRGPLWSGVVVSAVVVAFLCQHLAVLYLNVNVASSCIFFWQPRKSSDPGASARCVCFLARLEHPDYNTRSDSKPSGPGIVWVSLLESCVCG